MIEIAKKYQSTIAIVTTICFLGSCASISYSPKVSLDISAATINKTVTVEKFKDNSPVFDKKNPFLGYSVTDPDALSSELSTEISNAVIADFSINSVFKQVSRRVENSDFIMKGEINRFMGKSQMTDFGLISLFSYVGVITWYFGVPIRKNETDIQLKISMFDRNGVLINTYSGIYKDRVLNSMYKNTSLALPSQTNKSFSNAVAQIREQLLADIKKYQD